MKATLKNYHQSPRKVRLVADLIRGRSVSAAKSALRFLPKKSAHAIEKLLDSAVANAREAGASQHELVVRKITVDKGYVARRYRPFARGRAGSVRKTMSIIRLELGTAPSSAQASEGKAGKKNPSLKLEARSSKLSL